MMKAIVEYAKNRVQAMGKEVDFNVTTNATLLDDEKIAFIVEHKVTVLLSFDGPKELQDAQRPYADGKGSYDATVPKIKKLLEALPKNPGHAVIVGDTEPGIEKDALQKIGFAKINISPASQSLFAGEPDKTKEARDRSLIQALEREAETWLHLTKSRDLEGLKGLMEKSELGSGLLSLLHNRKKHHACDAGRGSVAVSVSGDVYLCHRFVGKDEYKLGNVFAKDLEREEYQKSPVTENKGCAVCFAKYYCAGGCKHDHASACGSIKTPSKDLCRVKRRQLELAATILCRLDTEDMKLLFESGIILPKPCALDF